MSGLYLPYPGVGQFFGENLGCCDDDVSLRSVYFLLVLRRFRSFVTDFFLFDKKKRGHF